MVGLGGRLTPMLAVLILVVGGYEPSAAAAQLTGEQFLLLSDGERTAYISGLVDMMARMAPVSMPEEQILEARFLRCMEGMSPAALRELTDHFMAADADTKKYTMPSNFRAALTVTCPKFPDIPQ